MLYFRNEMFCVECGKETKIYKNGVCIECYLKENKFTQGPEIIDLPLCTHCGSYKYRNNWTNELLTELLKRVVKKTFKISKELKKVDINSACNESKGGYECKIIISGFIDDFQVVEEHNVLVRLKKIVCDVCSKQFGGYHEAIIQVRTEGKKLNQEELKNIQLSVENIVQNLQAKGNRTLFITDVSQEHGGLDFFISDKQAALVITKNLHDEYGGNIKQSSKNIGMKDGKQVYRVTYLLRLPSYKKGDYVKINNSYYQIISIQKNALKLLNLANWKEELVDLNQIKNFNIIGGNELIKEAIMVSQNEKEVQIMNPKTYEITIIKKPKEYKINSKNVRIIKIVNQIFLEK